MSFQGQRSSHSLQEDLLRQVMRVLEAAQLETRPLELDPARTELFSLFVTAHGAGFLEEEGPVDLTADALCKLLAQRWGLDQAAQQSVSAQQKLQGEDLARLRLLWSLMRMWMEWTYAWQRWDEFHPAAESEINPKPTSTHSP